jgi:hypothetical protein
MVTDRMSSTYYFDRKRDRIKGGVERHYLPPYVSPLTGELGFLKTSRVVMPKAEDYLGN